MASTRTAPSPLWQHQEEAVTVALERMRSVNGALLAMGMGTGKTRVAIACCQRSGAKRILVVCPKSVISVWEEQLGMFWEGDLPAVFSRSSASIAKDLKTLASTLEATPQDVPLVAIVNYDVFSRATEMRSLLMNRYWDVVIADESHKLRNPKTKTTENLHKLRKHAGLCLTGTPYVNSHLDIWGQSSFCAPGVFWQPGYWQFLEHYTEFLPQGSRRKGDFVVKRHRNGDFLRGVPAQMGDFYDRVGQFAHMVKTSDVITSLPEAVDLKAYAVLPKKCRDAYEQMRDHMSVDLEAGRLTSANKDVAVTRLQQIVNGMVEADTSDGGKTLVDLGGKRETLAEVLDSIPADEPVVVFGRFHSDLAAVRDIAAANGHAVSEMSGRKNQLAEWRQGASRILAVQSDTGSEGIDLTRARYAIWYSLSWNPVSYKQARARFVRPGQASEYVRFIHILAQDTIDEDVYRRVVQKGEAADFHIAISKSKQDRKEPAK